MTKFLYFLLFFSPLLSAQINESDTLSIKANLSLTGFYQGGNVETIIFRAKSDFSFKPLKNLVFKTQNSYVYQEFGKEKADEDILSVNFLYLNPDRKVYPLLLGFISTNFRREIDLRSLVGAGVTYQIVNKKSHWLKLSLSSEYEQTAFGETNFNRSDYDGSESINTFRGTVWVNGKYNLFKKKVILKHELYFQPSLEQSNNFRWQADLALELPLWKFLNFKINYIHTFESIVIENQSQEDRFLTFGFTLKSFGLD
ncbi:DUF481 domain-containing protein [Psychroflexus sp. MES1-P1E]|uniref:DUF481 domain-containing protein n=1 Tax=Psychroflexus sp. MES1-P1E TaxID=2058320 RepID=UPI000C7B42A1|nr:DUF481 domain-containing protein [Psychroflexus sp. MES1-P1E]PKG43969.1 hypothetical protein CXF67_02170 [Psychroflexus sp. MES1-P1E]